MRERERDRDREAERACFGMAGAGNLHCPLKGLERKSRGVEKIVRSHMREPAGKPVQEP